MVARLFVEKFPVVVRLSKKKIYIVRTMNQIVVVHALRSIENHLRTFFSSSICQVYQLQRTIIFHAFGVCWKRVEISFLVLGTELFSRR